MKTIRLNIADDIYEMVLNFLELLPEEKVQLDVERVIPQKDDIEAHEEAVREQAEGKTILWRSYAEKRGEKRGSYRSLPQLS